MKRVVWITGLSGAGKTTLAAELALELRSRGEAVVLLDGDDLRKVFKTAEENDDGYQRKARMDLALQYGRLCHVLANQNLTVIISTISLFREVHDWNRANLPGYFEVFLKVPLKELRRRDPKGIYQNFEEGKLIHVAGLDIPVDEPDNPDLVLNFNSNKTIRSDLELILNLLDHNSGEQNSVM